MVRFAYEQRIPGRSQFHDTDVEAHGEGIRQRFELHRCCVVQAQQHPDLTITVEGSDYPHIAGSGAAEKRGGAQAKP